MTQTGRIILTRTESQNSAWQRELIEAGARVVSLPMIRFVDLRPDPLPDPGAFAWILFTSPQGVCAFFDAGLKPGAAGLGVLGEGTARELAAHGHDDQLGVRRKDGAEFAQAFLERVEGTVSILLPGPEHRLTEPAASLRAAGHTVTELPLYRTEAVPPAEITAVAPGPDDTIFFASPTAVRAYRAAFGVTGRCIAIGETTAEICRSLGFVTRVAEEPSLAAMAATIGLTLQNRS